MTQAGRWFTRGPLTRLGLAIFVVATTVAFPTVAGAASLSPSPSPSASASPGATSAKTPDRATWGVQPATANAPDRRALFSYGLTPQGQAFDHVAIVNYGHQPLKVNVYATDAFTASEGGFALLPTAERPRDAGSWISIGSRASVGVTVAAATATAPGWVILPVTISVPANAQPGDHSAGIVASSVTVGKNPKGENVKLDQRVASRVYLRVTGPLHPALEITNLSTRYKAGSFPWEPGSMDVSFQANNPGNVRLGFVPSVDVGGPKGVLKRHVDEQAFPELLPGNAHKFTITVKDVWPTFRVSTRVTLTPVAAPGAEAPTLAKATAKTTGTVIPWLLLLTLAVVLVGLRQLRRWRQRRSGASGFGPAGSSGGPTTSPAAPTDQLVGVPSKAGR